MINWIIGVFVTITGGSVYDPFWQQPSWRVFIEGGHFHYVIELKIEDGAVVGSAAFLMVENLARCISPENIRAENDDGRATPYQIVDEIGTDGVRRWSIQPIGKFRRTVAILDIDFVNKCSGTV